MDRYAPDMAFLPTGLEPVSPVPRRDYRNDPPVFLVRPETSDAKALEEVFDRDTYRLPRRGFTVDPGERWADCGSNIGSFAVLAGRYCGAAVVALEAEPVNAAIVANNAAANGLERVVWPVWAALVSKAPSGSTVQLHTNTEPLALRRHSVYKARKGSAAIHVPALPPEWLLEQGYDCWKLNIEGAEIPILLGGEVAGARKIVAEWSFDVDRHVGNLRRALDNLGRYFDNVHCSRSLIGLADTLEWPFYPPNAFVYAW